MNHKLTASDVRAMRQQALAGVSLGDLALAYNIHFETARAAVEGRSWGHIQDPPPLKPLVDCRLCGRKKPPRARCYCQKPHQRDTPLTEDEVATARRQAAAGMEIRQVARQLGRKYRQVHAAVIGYTWKEMVDPPPVRVSARVRQAQKHCRRCEILTNERSRLCIYCQEELGVR